MPCRCHIERSWSRRLCRAMMAQLSLPADGSIGQRRLRGPPFGGVHQGIVCEGLVEQCECFAVWVVSCWVIVPISGVPIRPQSVHRLCGRRVASM